MDAIPNFLVASFFILMRRLPQQSMAPYHRRKHVTRVTNFLTAAIMIPETWKLDMRSMVLCSLFFNYRRFPEPDIRGVLSGICGLFLSYGMNGMDFGTSDTAGQTLSPVYLNKHQFVKEITFTQERGANVSVGSRRNKEQAQAPGQDKKVCPEKQPAPEQFSFRFPNGPILQGRRLFYIWRRCRKTKHPDTFVSGFVLL